MVENILEVKGLKVYFPIKGDIIPKIVGNVRAVDGIDFNIRYGETLGLVGESGCGKSTVARAVLRVVDVLEGRVDFEGENILQLEGRRLKAVRKKLQLVFQDPFAALNPRMTVGAALEEVLLIHNLAKAGERKQRAAELLEMVGLTRKYLSRYPHEFSGGQRQRVVIARALAVNPSLVICDEPVSALDVSIQAQIINLLEELQERMGLSYLFISHDLGVVRHISSRVAVMYLGKIVEMAGTDELFDNPRHPYTMALLSAIPVCDPDSKTEKIILEGDIPSPVNPPGGCRFHTRCFKAKDICEQVEPEYIDLGGEHILTCHVD